MRDEDDDEEYDEVDEVNQLADLSYPPNAQAKTYSNPNGQVVGYTQQHQVRISDSEVTDEDNFFYGGAGVSSKSNMMQLMASDVDLAGFGDEPYDPNLML